MSKVSAYTWNIMRKVEVKCLNKKHKLSKSVYPTGKTVIEIWERRFQLYSSNLCPIDPIFTHNIYRNEVGRFRKRQNHMHVMK